MGKGVTLDLGLRIEQGKPARSGRSQGERNQLPMERQDRAARWAAHGIHRQGQDEVFGSYNVVNDVMKLLLAQTSFGAQSYEAVLLSPGTGWKWLIYQPATLMWS